MKKLTEKQINSLQNVLMGAGNVLRKELNLYENINSITVAFDLSGIIISNDDILNSEGLKARFDVGYK